MSLELPWERARKTKSERQEERVAALTGGSKQINSGRTSWRSVRDTKLFEFLIENRTTSKPTYSLDSKEFQQLRKQGFRTPPGCHPAIQIDFEQERLELITVELRTFHEILMELERLRTLVEERE